MAEIPKFLLRANWFNAEKMMPEEPNNEIKIQPASGLSPLMITIIIASAIVVLVVFMCIAFCCYFFIKKKPHTEVSKRSQIYMSEYF